MCGVGDRVYDSHNLGLEIIRKLVHFRAALRLGLGLLTYLGFGLFMLPAGIRLGLLALTLDLITLALGVGFLLGLLPI